MREAANTRVLIVGGGIGGLSAGIALRRAGFDVAIFERASDLQTIQTGGGFHLWANATRALSQLGLCERAEAVGAPIERTEFRTWQGTLLGTWPVGEVGRRLGVPNLGISRKDLHRMLADALPDGVVQRAAECVGFSQEPGRVKVQFADGREEHGDVLIGADGIRSAIRARLHGSGEPRYAGYTQWQALTDFPDTQAPFDLEQVVFGRGLRFVHHRVGQGRLFWAAIVYAPEGSNRKTEGRKASLLAAFKNWHGPIAAMIEATDETAIGGKGVYDRPPLTRWGAGQITLLGDAAHPMTTNLSQGGCLAIEDAVVLARCLRACRDIPSALRDYEGLRMQRTAPITRLSWRLAVVGGWEHPAACALRDRALKQILGGVGRRAHERDMAYPL
jgi:2-polyprenyl-6-methoxyphenol hydroxylase-like FAD-dependent oxidoreductase